MAEQRPKARNGRHKSVWSRDECNYRARRDKSDLLPAAAAHFSAPRARRGAALSPLVLPSNSLMV